MSDSTLSAQYGPSLENLSAQFDSTASEVDIHFDFNLESQIETDRYHDVRMIRLLTERGQSALDRGGVRVAEMLALQALRMNSESVDSMSLLANVFEKSGRIQDAIKTREQIRKRVQDPRNLIDLGRLFADRLDHEAALSAYQDCLILIDTEGFNTEEAQEIAFECYKAIGNIFVRSGDYESADDYYARAHRLRPDSDVLMVNQGTLELTRDRMDQAQALFQSAVIRNPQNDKAWVGLALVHRSFGDYELSRANLEQALDLDPSNRTAIRVCLEWAVRDAYIQGARQRVERYLELDPEDVEVAFSLAKLCVLLGDLGAALFECERVLAFDAENEDAVRLRQVLAQKILEEPKA